MKTPRRKFLRLMAGAAALPLLPRAASADAYPTRPVRILVGYPAGIAPDIFSRIAAQGLSERLGQQFIVENRPGANSNVATELVVRASPDGYTLLTMTATNAINATLYEGHLNFDLLRDLAPVGGLMRSASVIQVTPSLPVKTLAEFIAYAKANPGKLNYASAGSGSATNVAGELFRLMTGIDLVHIAYHSNYLPDLMSGQVQASFSPVAQSIEFIKAGKLRPLAVTSATRLEALPDVPAANRDRARLRGLCVGRLGRAGEHAGRCDRQDQQGIERCTRHAGDEGALRRARRRAVHRDAGRIRQIPGRRNQEMGRRDQGRQYPRGVNSTRESS